MFLKQRNTNIEHIMILITLFFVFPSLTFPPILKATQYIKCAIKKNTVPNINAALYVTIRQRSPINEKTNPTLTNPIIEYPSTEFLYEMYTIIKIKGIGFSILRRKMLAISPIT
jgi:hypothetical protein